MLIQNAIDERFILVLPESIIIETRAVIDKKFAGHPGVSTGIESLALLSKIAEIVPESEAVTYFQQAKACIRDVKDAPHLAAALASKPDIFVTSDSDYYNLSVPVTFQILTARQVLIELEKA